MKKDINTVVKKFTDEFIVPICDKTYEILKNKRLVWTCLFCGTTYTRIYTDDKNITVRLTCNCGEHNEKIVMPISKLLSSEVGKDG